MERLTYGVGNENRTYGLIDKASAKPGLFTDYDGFYANLLAHHRLGQYEDILFDADGKELCTVEHLTELVKAESEGWLALLSIPMLPMVEVEGDSDVYCPRCGYDLSGSWNEYHPDQGWTMCQCPNCGQSICDTKVMSRAEAEAALGEERGENGKDL